MLTDDARVIGNLLVFGSGELNSVTGLGDKPKAMCQVGGIMLLSNTG